MDNNTNNTWGIYGSASIIGGIISCFVPGLSALFLGFIAVILGFLGKRKHQKLSQSGLLIGGIILLFANLVNLGIIPAHRFVHSDKYHLVNSINESIRAFDVMTSAQPNDLKQKELLKHLRFSLNEARLVNIENVDRQVKGFSDHYRDEFIAGTEDLIQGYENDDTLKKLQGGNLLDKWAKWNQEHRSNLGKIKEPGMSVFSFFYGIFTI